MIPNQVRQASELITIELGWTTRFGLRFQCLFAAIMVFGEPGVDRADIDVQRLRQFFWFGTIDNQMYDSNPQGFFASTAQFSTIGIAFAFHVSQYNLNGFTLFILSKVSPASCRARAFVLPASGNAICCLIIMSGYHIKGLYNCLAYPYARG